MDKWLKIEEIFDLKEWEKLQDVLAEETKMAIIIVDYKGNPVTKHSCSHKICRMAREDERLKGYCQRCDARGGFEAMSNREVYIYKCYLGLVDVAIPIIVNNRYIGAILAGQVKLQEEDQDELETILMPSHQEYIENKKTEWIEYDKELPTLSYGRIKVIAQLIYHICNFMCSEFSDKLRAIEMYETLFNNNVYKTNIEDEIESPLSVQTEHNRDNVYEKYLGYDYNRYHKCIRQVVEYLVDNKASRPSLADMAELCHVSTGYLSHLFTKELGESYSSFVSRIKMEWAKEMLEETDESVNVIGEQVGFYDATYFIKVFKKHVGVTPLVYKKYAKMKK